jgi:hypothetical protein
MRTNAVLATYNRPPHHQWRLEEAIESFLRQDYVDKELLVLNDRPAQHLQCKAPDVTVINLPGRFRSLGAKRNDALSLTTGAISFCCDDDISLPWRVSASIPELTDAEYICPSRYGVADAAGMHHDSCASLLHPASAFTRKAFDAVGGHPHLSFREDAAFDEALRRAPGISVAFAPPPVQLCYFIYRWGVSPTHMSSRGPDPGWYDEIGRSRVEPGAFILAPHWCEDYVGRTRTALHAGRSAVGGGKS